MALFQLILPSAFASGRKIQLEDRKTENVGVFSPLTWSKTFNILRRAPKAFTPRSSRALSSSSMRSVHFMSFRLSVYLCRRRLLSQLGISWSSVGSVGSSGGLELPLRPLGERPRAISEWS